MLSALHRRGQHRSSVDGARIGQGSRPDGKGPHAISIGAIRRSPPPHGLMAIGLGVPRDRARSKNKIQKIKLSTFANMPNHFYEIETPINYKQIEAFGARTVWAGRARDSLENQKSLSLLKRSFLSFSTLYPDTPNRATQSAEMIKKRSARGCGIFTPNTPEHPGHASPRGLHKPASNDADERVSLPEWRAFINPDWRGTNLSGRFAKPLHSAAARDWSNQRRDDVGYC
jgi:hypothetical protein